MIVGSPNDVNNERECHKNFVVRQMSKLAVNIKRFFVTCISNFIDLSMTLPDSHQDMRPNDSACNMLQTVILNCCYNTHNPASCKNGLCLCTNDTT
jgi:hypothetical protein